MVEVVKMVRKNIERARRSGFMCFTPDGSQGADELAEMLMEMRMRGEEIPEDIIPCTLCKLCNSVGPWGCPHAY